VTLSNSTHWEKASRSSGEAEMELNIVDVYAAVTYQETFLNAVRNGDKAG